MNNLCTATSRKPAQSPSQVPEAQAVPDGARARCHAWRAQDLPRYRQHTASTPGTGMVKAATKQQLCCRPRPSGCDAALESRRAR